MTGSQTTALLSVRDVSLQYNTANSVVTAVSQLSFEVHTSDRFVLLGPSGCGKSTLLKAVAGFIEPTAGKITLAGKPVCAPGPERAMVFQEFDQLLPWKTVTGNIMFPLVATGMATAAARERAALYIEKVGLSRFANSYPHTLSGGMKQRVAIARAMAMEPGILLMDEPFAALDALTRDRMQEELLRLCADTDSTVLFVTHSIAEAIRIGTRILLLSPHPGRAKAELNCDGIDTADASGEHLSQRIRRLLFGNLVEEDTADD
ncbi:MAG: ABC transporter ATP-binding protein [Gammaproteobacteria bacterium]|nr:ABC transporter ATP-binding protein [Gammaproteobacteria bacterium]